jgi:Sugar (and other) transporter
MSFTNHHVSWFDYGMSFAKGSITWRLPIAFQIIFAVIVMILIIDLPESPRFLVASNRHEEATQVLCRLFDEPESSESVTRERQSILDAIEIDAGEGVSWMSLLKNDSVKTRRRTLLAFAVMVRIGCSTGETYDAKP